MEMNLSGLYVFCIYLYSTEAANLCEKHKFTREPGYDNVTIIDTLVWQLGNIALPKCMWQCLITKGCFSIQYQHSIQTCSAFTKFYTSESSPPLNMPDLILYISDKEPESECVSDSDCPGGEECILGLCYCTIGYSRDGSTCRPHTECQRFTNSFKKFPRSFIWGGSVTQISNSSPSECRLSCIATAGCVSFDFNTWAIAYCYPKDLAWMAALPSERKVNDGSHHHYQRECDWAATNSLT